MSGTAAFWAPQYPCLQSLITLSIHIPASPGSQQPEQSISLPPNRQHPCHPIIPDPSILGTPIIPTSRYSAYWLPQYAHLHYPAPLGTPTLPSPVPSTPGHPHIANLQVSSTPVTPVSPFPIPNIRATPMSSCAFSTCSHLFQLSPSRSSVPSSRTPSPIPLKKGSCLPDVGVAHAAPRWVCDILLLKQVVHGLGHHGDSVTDVGRLVLAVDELQTDHPCRGHRGGRSALPASPAAPCPALGDSEHTAAG